MVDKIYKNGLLFQKELLSIYQIGRAEKYWVSKIIQIIINEAIKDKK